MEQPRGERSHGANPADISGGQRAETVEPITLVDLDGAVTRIAPSGSWTREQVRHPGDQPLFITRLERGELWHEAGQRGMTWTHEVQVGPATVVSERGRFHVVAEPDGGATITCLQGQVAVATHRGSPMLLEPGESVAVAADGESSIIAAPAPAGLVPSRSGAASPAAGPGPRGITRTMRAWGTAAGRPNLLLALLALVALLLVVLIVVLVFDRSGGSGAIVGPLGYPWPAEVLR